MVRQIDVDIVTSSGSLDVSADVDGTLDFERTTLLKAAPFTIRLENSDGSYDGKFSRYDPVTIRVEKNPGSGVYEDMFAGRIENIENKRPHRGGKKRVVILEGFDYYMDLQAATHSGVFKTEAAGTIMSNLLLTYCPDIDRTNIDTGPTLTFIGGQDKKVSEWIEEILDQPECVGWKFWIKYKKAYFKNLSESHAALVLTDNNVSGEISVKKRNDLYANRVKVYGAKNSIHPATLDDYTEADAANWVKSNITLTDEGAEKKRGNYSLKGAHTFSVARSFKRSFTSALNLNVLEHLWFWFRSNTTLAVQIRLETDAANYYSRNFIPPKADEWVEKEYLVGADAQGWTATGAPNWANITAIMFYWPSTDTTTATTYLDYLRFLGAGVIKVAENWAEIKTHGIREPDPIVDESIIDPTFAEKLAKAWLSDLGVAKTEIQTTQTESDIDLSKIEEGKLVSVDFDSEGLTDNFVHNETKYHFKPHYGLDVEYLLGDPPSPYQLQIRNMMRELDRLKQKAIEPTRNYDVWNRFYLEAPSPLASLKEQDQQAISMLIEENLFPYSFPFWFAGLSVEVTLTITEES